jgi:hypothetical protein
VCTCTPSGWRKRVNLSGLDILLKGTAETSFNYLLIGVILGALAGFLAGKLWPGESS